MWKYRISQTNNDIVTSDYKTDSITLNLDKQQPPYTL